MKKRTIIFIAVFALIALAGIVFTQVYWMKESLRLKEEQFDNSIRIATKSVLNQLLIYKNDSSFQEKLYELSCKKPKLDVTDIIEPFLLDSLLKEELGTMYVSDKYYYGIYNRNNNKFYMGQFDGKESRLLKSPYQFSVTSIYNPGSYYLTIYYPAKTSIILRQMEIWLAMSILFLLVVIISFAYVIYVILRQKKISEMRTDFINNLTHEFKTPIATSSLAAEMLIKSGITDKTRIKKYAKVILDENQRLQNQVEQVLQIATLEKGGKKFTYREIDIHQLLKEVIDNFDLRFKEKDARLELKLNAARHKIQVDQDYVVNVFNNLIDNALKYTPEKPRISINSRNSKNGIHISVSDNGIGISTEHQRDVFKNLFRVPTGNIHEVRGFGLGLYYAKTIVDQHGGYIDLESEPGKGSIFDVYLPINSNKM